MSNYNSFLYHFQLIDLHYDLSKTGTIIYRSMSPGLISFLFAFLRTFRPSGLIVLRFYVFYTPFAPLGLIHYNSHVFYTPFAPQINGMNARMAFPGA